MIYLLDLGLIQRFFKSDGSQIKRQKHKIPDILVKRLLLFAHFSSSDQCFEVKHMPAGNFALSFLFFMRESRG